MRVFIVEDSLVIRDRLHNLIDCMPNVDVVGEADNESDAVRAICVIQPDLAILDLTLASGNGMEVLRQIRAESLSLWVIVLTNYAYPQYQKKCMELGADYFLDKSRDIETLGSLLLSLSDGSHLHREHRSYKG